MANRSISLTDDVCEKLNSMVEYYNQKLEEDNVPAKVSTSEIIAQLIKEKFKELEL